MYVSLDSSVRIYFINSQVVESVWIHCLEEEGTWRDMTYLAQHVTLEREYNFNVVAAPRVFGVGCKTP